MGMFVIIMTIMIMMMMMMGMMMMIMMMTMMMMIHRADDLFFHRVFGKAGYVHFYGRSVGHVSPHWHRYGSLREDCSPQRFASGHFTSG